MHILKLTSMKSHTKAILATMCGGLVLSLAQTASADLVANGDFTATTPISAANPSSASGGELHYNIEATGWTSTGYNFLFSSGAAAVSGVNSSYGAFSLWGDNTFNGSTVATALGTTAVPGGGGFIGADGAFEVGAITQTINGLTAGHQYDVSFYYAAAQQKGNNYKSATSDYWTVNLGSQIASSTVGQSTETLSLPGEDTAAHAANNFSGWVHATMTFTASAASDILSFLATGSPSGQPPFALLTDVSVEAAPTSTPEPSSLVGGGLAVLALVASSGRMFRKAKQS